MGIGECRDLGAVLDGAVVVDQLGENADRGQAGQPAEIDRGLGVTGTHEDAAVAGDQREDVAGPDKIRSAGIGIGEAADCIAALFGGDAGGQARPEIDRHREGGAERGVVVGDHRLQTQAVSVGAGQGCADDPGCVADDEGTSFSGVAWLAARMRSPSFSRSSSSVTTSISPRRNGGGSPCNAMRS